MRQPDHYSSKGSLPLTLLAALLLGGAASARAQSNARPLPPLPDAQVEVVAKLTQGPGNVAVTPNGRVILSQHQFYSPEVRVVELLKDGRTVPFPTERWARAPGADGVGLNAVLGIRSDRQGVVWMLDNGGEVPRVVAWDTQANKLHRVIPIRAPATRRGSLHNDLAVDLSNGALYLADISGDNGPAIVVVDLNTGAARRVLEGHASVQAEDIPTVIEGRPLRQRQPDGTVRIARVGLNPITIDPSSEWVYYGAMHGDDIWRVRTRDLIDVSLAPDELNRRVERYGTKPPSDGIAIDSAGHVYVTDITRKAIGVTGPSGTYRLYAQDDERLAWPDGISAGPDGWMYATVNKLHRSAALNGGESLSEPPYYLVRFRSVGTAVPRR
jgi:sugar lactone lactonase YvrE